MKFRKKPVVIDAIRWLGTERCLNEDVLPFLLDGNKDFKHLPRAPDDAHIENGIGYTPPDGNLFIPTLEGTMTAKPGDWIIRGVKGEFYPCKPDIFEATYEAALAQQPASGMVELLEEAQYLLELWPLHEGTTAGSPAPAFKLAERISTALTAHLGEGKG